MPVHVSRIEQLAMLRHRSVARPLVRRIRSG